MKLSFSPRRFCSVIGDVAGGLSWIGRVEVLDSGSSCGEVRFWLPACLVVRPFVSFPLYEILEFAGPVISRVEYS